jgi:hypothetical protein
MTAPQEPSLADKVAFLSRPEAYTAFSDNSPISASRAKFAPLP